MARSTTGNDRGLKSYLTGFALALILTAIPFALVAANPLPKLPTLIIIGVAAVIQVLVHLRYFLHLDLTSTPRENLLAIVFTAHSHFPHGRRQLLDHARPEPPDVDVVPSARRLCRRSPLMRRRY